MKICGDTREGSVNYVHETRERNTQKMNQTLFSKFSAAQDMERAVTNQPRLSSEIQIFRLTKMQPIAGNRLWKSPSLPSSPVSYKSETHSNHAQRDIPSYLTLGRRGISRKPTGNDYFSIQSDDSIPETDTNEMDRIRSILASLDLAKYKRKGTDPNINAPLRRTDSDQSTPCYKNDSKEICTTNASVSHLSSLKYDTKVPNQRKCQEQKETFPYVDKSKESDANEYKSLDSKNVNTRLRKLTERLASSSAPSSPLGKTRFTMALPPWSATPFSKDVLPPLEQMTLATREYERDSKTKTAFDFDRTSLSSKMQFSTLPRTKPSVFLNQFRRESETSRDDSSAQQNACKILEGGPKQACAHSIRPFKLQHTENQKKKLPNLPQFLFAVRNDAQNNSEEKRVGIHLNELNFGNTQRDSLAYPAATMEDNVIPAQYENNCKQEIDKVDEQIKQYSLSASRNKNFEKSGVDAPDSSCKIDTFSLSTPFAPYSKSCHFATAASSMKPSPSPASSSQKLSEVNKMNASDSTRSNLDESRSLLLDGNNNTTNEGGKAIPTQERRYFKKRLRGPYGEMLEHEMSKPPTKHRPAYSIDLDFLKEATDSSPTKFHTRSYLLSSFESSCPKRKTSANIPLIQCEKTSSALPVVTCSVSEPALQSKCGPPWLQFQDDNEDDEAQIRLAKFADQDTRTHVVGELYETEKSYVESLQIVVKKYMKPLKSSEHCGVIESAQVDEIFLQIPEILSQHESFLDVLKQRLSNWDTKQKIGDVFVDVFTRQSVIDTYTAFINNWKIAKETIKSASLAKPAFAKFLEHTSREHKGKLTLDALLIMPVQRIPRYELLIKELLKHTPVDHPDHQLLLQAQKEVHDLAVNINRLERAALEQEMMIEKLKEIEHLMEGIVDLVHCDRAYIRHDFICTLGGLGIKKDRCLFLFSDLLLITSIKKRAPLRKTSISLISPSSSLESNKYKLLMKLPLQNVELTKKVDERSVKRFLAEVGHLEADVAVLGKISDMLATLSCHHQVLDDAVKDILSLVSKQLIDKQTTNSQLMAVDLAVTMQNDVENLIVIFPNPEKRLSWEISFGEAKKKLATICGKIPSPSFLCTIPIQRSRAGLQVTCAAPSQACQQNTLPTLWICNSDDYAGQVCILNLSEEPSLISCTNICSSKIICMVCVPGIPPSQTPFRRQSTVLSHFTPFKLETCGTGTNMQSFQLDSDTSEDEDYIDGTYISEGTSTARMTKVCNTMWLGMENGVIYVYDCNDASFKIKLKIQHSAAVHDLIYANGKVYTALSNGDIFVYSRNKESGVWDTRSPLRVQVGSVVAPITKMLLAGDKLWCGSSNTILLLNIHSHEIENTFQVVADSDKTILTLALSGVGVWVAILQSPIVYLFHASLFHKIVDVNIAPAVTKMLSAYDDIIRQHKSACLRVSALHICNNVLWIGTSAGVLLTVPIPHSTAISPNLDLLPNISGLSQGHTGHARAITSVEITSATATQFTDIAGPSGDSATVRKDTQQQWPHTSVMVVCAGDGYEDFNCLNVNESAGCSDSTSHLLIWKA